MATWPHCCTFVWVRSQTPCYHPYSGLRNAVYQCDIHLNLCNDVRVVVSQIVCLFVPVNECTVQTYRQIKMSVFNCDDA